MERGITMTAFGLALFGFYLLIMVILDLAMMISFIKPGDERRQMIVWKSSTWTLIAVTRSMVMSIIGSIVQVREMSMNPFATLTAAATVYFICLLYYRRQYGD